MGTVQALFDDDLFDLDSGASDAASQTQKALVDTHQQMGVMLDIMPIGLLVHTSQGIIFANRAAARLLEIEQQAIVGNHVLDFMPDAPAMGVSERIESAFASTEPVEFEAQVRSHAGQERSVKFIVAALPWPGNPVIQVLMQDVTEQKRAEQTLRRLTITDELTGAFNRRHATYEAGLYLPNEGSSGIGLSVLLLDIDHFKAVNDRYGHQAGDEALKALTKVGTRTLKRVHPDDAAIFSRFGGEEFLVLLPGAGSAKAMQIAEELRKSISAIEVPYQAGSFSLTASFGVAEFSAADGGLDGLLVRADAALYRSKAEGRNRVSLA